MKMLAPQDRPREKLVRHGAAALGDNELLALVLGEGTQARGALDLANELLATCGGPRGLTRAGVAQLRRLGGIGEARAARVLAAVEIGRRTLLVPQEAPLKIRAPRDAAAYLLPQFGARPVEQFGAVLLDSKHHVLRSVIVSVGTVDAAVVHPRDVFREPLLHGATAVVLFHNHPSGDPAPSRDDIALTMRLVESGRLLGIEVVDHVILADTRYFSFKEDDNRRRPGGAAGPGPGGPSPFHFD